MTRLYTADEIRILSENNAINPNHEFVDLKDFEKEKNRANNLMKSALNILRRKGRGCL